MKGSCHVNDACRRILYLNRAAEEQLGCDMSAVGTLNNTTYALKKVFQSFIFNLVLT